MPYIKMGKLGRETAYSLRYVRSALLAPLAADFGPSTLLAAGPKYAAWGNIPFPCSLKQSYFNKI